MTLKSPFSPTNQTVFISDLHEEPAWLYSEIFDELDWRHVDRNDVDQEVQSSKKFEGSFFG